MPKSEERQPGLDRELDRLREESARQVTYSAWDRDPVKQYVRRYGWLHVIQEYVERRRHAGVHRPLKYLTLPGPYASDIGLLYRHGLLTRTADGFPWVAICDESSAEQVVATLGSVLGYSSRPFEEAVKWPQGDLCGYFPFDVINLDLTGAVVTDHEDRARARRRLDGIRSVFSLQCGQSFLLLLTTSTEAVSGRRYLKEVVLSNLDEGPFREKYQQKYGTLDLDPFDDDYRGLVRVALPKAIARVARDYGFGLVEHFVGTYERPAHRLISHSFELQQLSRRKAAKQYEPLIDQPPWDELTERLSRAGRRKADAAYDDFLPSVLERDPEDIPTILAEETELEADLCCESESLVGWQEPNLRGRDQ